MNRRFTFAKAEKSYFVYNLRRSFLISTLLVTLFFVSINNVFSDGSKNLFPKHSVATPQKGRRASLLSTNTSSQFNPFATNGVLKAYVKVGETIYTGSSVQGKFVGTTYGQIIIRKPNGTVAASSANTSGDANLTKGQIANWTQEDGGPNTSSPYVANASKYNPFTFVADVEGIWEIEFKSMDASGSGTNLPTTVSSNPTATSPLHPNDGTTNYPNFEFPVSANFWTQPQTTGSAALIAAWDVSIGSGGTLIPGRVYSNVFSATLPNNFPIEGGIYSKVYVLTNVGYTYKVSMNGQNGASFNFFSNNKGVHDGTSVRNPIFKSYNATSPVDTLKKYIYDPRNADTETDVTHKIFYTKPAADLPVLASYYNGTGTSAKTTWLKIPAITPEITAISVRGKEGTPNQVGKNGAYIVFTSTIAGRYIINVDANGNGSFTDAVDLTLEGYSDLGENSVFWDGKNGLGGSASPGFATINVKAKVFTAEVHFPFADVEINPHGFIIELTTDRITGNEAGSYEPLSGKDIVFWDDSNISGFTGTRTNTTPSPNKTGENGISSNTNGHKWGAELAAGGAGTGSGTINTATGARDFGNEKLLDTWAYITSPELSVESELYIAVADLQVESVTRSATTSIYTGNPVTFEVVVKNNNLPGINSISDVIGATFSFKAPLGFIINPDDVVFTSDIPGKAVSQTSSTTATYDSVTGIYTIKLDMTTGSQATFTILGTPGETLNGAAVSVEARIMRPADVTDPNATAAEEDSPSDPHVECNAGGAACNNIEAMALSIEASMAIGGMVWNDVNGNAVLNSPIEGFSNAGGLFANLVDADNKVIESVGVNGATGDYSFAKGLKNTSYRIILTSALKIEGSELTVSDLPSGWVNTGVNTGSANTGNKTGIISLTTGSVPLSDLSFGIQQVPTAVAHPIAPQVNPGGTKTVAVPVTSFEGIDPANGTIEELLIVGFPINASSISVGTTTYYATLEELPMACLTSVCAVFPEAGILIETDANGHPLQLIEVDPVSSTDTFTVKMPFIVKDNAGTWSSDTANVELEFTPNKISIAAATLCKKDVPYLSYSVTGNFDLTGMTATIEWVDDANVVVLTQTNQSLSGMILYPGATMVDSIGTGWPGWEFTGGQWQETTGNYASIRNAGSKVRISVNPVEEYTISYPPSSPACLTTPPVLVSGKVWHDSDGSANHSFTNINTGTEAGTNAGNAVYAVVTGKDPSDGDIVKILGSVLVGIDGVYAFDHLLRATDHAVYLTNDPGSMGSSVLPVAILPLGWGNTSPLIHVPVDGATENVTDLDFGIQQLPVPHEFTALLQPNPGGTVNVPLDGAGFGGNDPDGTVESIRITQYPEFATSFTVGTTTYYPDLGDIPVVCPTATCEVFDSASGLLIPTDEEGNPLEQIGSDPAQTAGGMITIYYTVIDNAGGESNDTGYYAIPFSPFSISGNVFNDANGLKDGNGVNEGVVNGNGVNGGGLYANLLDVTGATIVATTIVETNGSYSLPAELAIAYTVQITKNKGVPGGTAPTTELNSNWVYTGENIGVGIGNDTEPDGLLAIPVVVGDVVDVNFGINQIAQADAKSQEVIREAFRKTPSAGFSSQEGYLSISGKSTYLLAGSLSGSDPEDCTAASSCSEGSTFRIEQITATTRLFYAESDGSAIEIQEGDILENFDPGKLEIYGELESSTFEFSYRLIDAAGTESGAKMYTITTDSALPVVLTEFSVIKEKGTALLKWITSSETNSWQFEVERSDDGKIWGKIGSVLARGETATKQIYTYSDKTPVNGRNLYRLKIIDRNGRFTYSVLRSIIFESQAETFVYPNPVADRLQIRVKDQDKVKQISIQDLNGRVIYSSDKVSDGGIDVTPIGNGIYFLRITDDEKSFLYKILINR